jgi:hypothetical protein
MAGDMRSALLDRGGAGFYFSKKLPLYATNERSVFQRGSLSFWLYRVPHNSLYLKKKFEINELRKE